jgi:hypothetical protein
MYEARFREVLKFHSPGLAPVLDDSGAYHVDVGGRAAYGPRYLRAFGFYEGFAAVAAADGWVHVRPDGQPVSAERWAWAGNYQGGRCTVRDRAGRYRHLDERGYTAYEGSFRYVGDFRDGIAVVQRDDGYSTHVDRLGEEVHGQWFVDLDVFHKGFARARGEDGWMHVDRLGHPVYRRRFAAVEPFYNGQARVERDDGGIEVVDEQGQTLVEVRSARRSPLHAVSGELVSFWRCEAVFAAVECGLFERLPMAQAEVSTTEDRLLGGLGELGLVDRVGGSWVVTASGSLLTSGHPSSLRSVARYWADAGRRDWAELSTALRDPFWRRADPFAAAAADTAALANLQDALRPYAEHDYADIGRVIDPGLVVIDAGGGSGLLATALLRFWPNAHGVVFDRPEVAERGEVPTDLAGRLQFVGGDLFQPWTVSADSIVLAHVLHDWPDEQAAEILRRGREAVPRGGMAYIVELVRPTDGFHGGLLSLHLWLSTGGQERTAEEFHELLQRAGWEFREVRRLGAVVDVVVARAT